MTRIHNLPDLQCAVLRKQAVIVPKDRCWDRPRPAAFVLNLSGAILIRLFQSGMFIYEKKIP